MLLENFLIDFSGFKIKYPMTSLVSIVITTNLHSVIFSYVNYYNLKQLLRSCKILELYLYNVSYIPFRLLKEKLSHYG